MVIWLLHCKNTHFQGHIQEKGELFVEIRLYFGIIQMYLVFRSVCTNFVPDYRIDIMINNHKFMAGEGAQSAKKHYICRRFLRKRRNDLKKANKTARI